ncbi:MAG: hypothetical protein AXW15_12020 [Neptuniibacter sp. Phe_28]|jgi:hypothetical protein|nr:MAG: hypothetical protein AXW15_12020 [Neptuniibacter sp. Phe_28]
MKKLLAISILCSSSALIGFTVAAGMELFSYSVAVEAHDKLAKECKATHEHLIDSNAYDRLTVWDVLNADDPRAIQIYKASLEKLLFMDAEAFRASIKESKGVPNLEFKIHLLETLRVRSCIVHVDC